MAKPLNERHMVHAINADREITPRVKKEIEDCHGILVDVLSWLFETEVSTHSTEVKTSVNPIEMSEDLDYMHPDERALVVEDTIADSSLFKIVVELDRRKVLTTIMDKLSPEQQAELSAYLMRREYGNHR